MSYGKTDLAMRAAVVELRNKQLTMSEVAAKLGITKNAVAGHCNLAREAGVHVESVGSFGLQPRKKPISPKYRGALSRKAANSLPEMNSTVAPETSAEAVALPDKKQVVSQPASIPQRVRTCQFIAGERGGKRRVDFALYTDPDVFCGEPAREGSSYCPAHHRKTHTRPKQQDGAAFVPGTVGAVDTAWR